MYYTDIWETFPASTRSVTIFFWTLNWLRFIRKALYTTAEKTSRVHHLPSLSGLSLIWYDIWVQVKPSKAVIPKTIVNDSNISTIEKSLPENCFKGIHESHCFFGKPGGKSIEFAKHNWRKGLSGSTWDMLLKWNVPEANVSSPRLSLVQKVYFDWPA